MKFFEVKNITWHDRFFIESGNSEIRIPQNLEMDSYFYMSENEADKKYEAIVADLKKLVKDNGIEVLVPDGIEGGHGIEVNLSSGLDFEIGKRNFWFDTGDSHFGVILYECETLDEDIKI